MFAGEGLELFDIVLRMDGLEDFEAESAKAIEMTLGDVVAKVRPLSRILASKRAAARPKDRLVVLVPEEVVHCKRHDRRIGVLFPTDPRAAARVRVDSRHVLKTSRS
jgi:hypothetical protein